MRRDWQDENDARPCPMLQQGPLSTATIKLPHGVEAIWKRVAADCDLLPSAAYRVALTKLAEILEGNWQRGLALSTFLEGLKFDGAQLNLFFGPKENRK